MTNNPLDHLKEFSKLERQTMGLQVVLMLNLFERGFAPQDVVTIEHNGHTFYEGKSIRNQLGGDTIKANLHKANYALLNGGFVERLVIDPDGNVILHENYSKKTSILYWRLTAKAHVLLGNA